MQQIPPLIKYLSQLNKEQFQQVFQAQKTQCGVTVQMFQLFMNSNLTQQTIDAMNTKQRDVTKKSLLFYAVAGDVDPEICANLDCLISQPDAFKTTALMFAAKFNHQQWVQYLIEDESGFKDLQGRTALMYCIVSQPQAPELLDLKYKLIDFIFDYEWHILDNKGMSCLDYMRQAQLSPAFIQYMENKFISNCVGFGTPQGIKVNVERVNMKAEENITGVTSAFQEITRLRTEVEKWKQICQQMQLQNGVEQLKQENILLKQQIEGVHANQQQLIQDINDAHQKEIDELKQQLIDNQQLLQDSAQVKAELQKAKDIIVFQREDMEKKIQEEVNKRQEIQQELQKTLEQLQNAKTQQIEQNHQIQQMQQQQQLQQARQMEQDTQQNNTESANVQLTELEVARKKRQQMQEQIRKRLGQIEQQQIRLPIILEDGRVVYEEQQNKSTQKQQQNHEEQQQQKSQDKNLTTQELKKKLSKYCQAIMKNPADKANIQGLLKLVDSEEIQQNKEQQQLVMTSLFIVLKNNRNEPLLAQLKNLYNQMELNQLQQQIKQIIVNEEDENCLINHQKLIKRLQLDSQFYYHTLVAKQIQKALSKHHFRCVIPNTDENVFTYFLQLKLNSLNISNVTLNFKPKKQNKKNKNDINYYSKANIEQEQQENAREFITVLVSLACEIISQYPSSNLVQYSIKILLKYSQFMNKYVFNDIINSIKMYFYMWYSQNKQHIKQSLIQVFEEEPQSFINIKVNKTYQLTNQLTKIDSYIQTIDLSLFQQYKYLTNNFSLCLSLILFICRQSLSENGEIKGNNEILLIYLMMNLYKINEKKRISLFIQILKEFFTGFQGGFQGGSEGSQFYKFVVKIANLIDSQEFYRFSNDVAVECGLDPIENQNGQKSSQNQQQNKIITNNVNSW